MAKDKLFLVLDGYSLLFRAFYSTKYLSTSSGKPSNAIYGFLQMMFTLVNRLEPDSLVVALDAHEPTFRHEAFEAYKGTRKETPNELLQQLIEVRRVIEAFQLPWLEKGGFEADDIVGTLSKRAAEFGFRTAIVTGDLDSLQLVDKDVTVYVPRQGVTEMTEYNPEAVEQRYGFGPEHVVDYKALVGDTSDNIPGVPGIGDKSATLLIQKFGSTEQIVERIEEVEEKFKKKLIPALDQIPKSKHLATIVRDVDVDFSFEPFQMSADAVASASRVLDEYEFKSLLRRLESVFGRYLAGGQAQETKSEVVDEPVPVHLGEQLGTLAAAMSWVNGKPYGLFVAEGASTDLLSQSESVAYLSRGSEVRPLSVDLVHALFERSPGLVVTHDAKPFFVSGEQEPALFDLHLAGYVLNPGRNTYTLRDLAQGYLDFRPIESHEQAAAMLFPLKEALEDRLKKEEQLDILLKVEQPVTPIIAEMEKLGIVVSKEHLKEFSDELKGEIEETEQKIFETAGEKFLISSPKQLGEVLFEKLNLPLTKKSKLGWSTGAEVLEELAPQFPVVRDILHWRELTKLKSTYADALPRMVREDGRIHTTLNQTVAATGRLSSQDPNLQNIPIRTELGRKIRQAFLPSEGNLLGSFDYSQIELRLLAHLSEDAALVEAFQERVDVHTVTAAIMFGVQNAEVTSEQRRYAKILNYAVLYGVSGYGLAAQLGEGFSIEDGNKLIKQYFERFPTVKDFMDAIVKDAREKGFTRTILGRKRYFPDIHASNRMNRLYSERQAMNAPFQGSAADLIKVAMIDVRKAISGFSSKTLLQVHDELLFDVDPSEKESLSQLVIDKMEQAQSFKVPIEADAKYGPNWCDMVKADRA